MSEKSREVPQLDNATYAHTLVIGNIYEYKVNDQRYNETCLIWVPILITQL